MDFNKLTAYVERKKLSDSAKVEIIQRLNSETIQSREDADKLAEILLKLHADILYEYIKTCLRKVERELGAYLLERVREDEGNGVKYLVVAAAASAKTGDIAQTEKFLQRILEIYTAKKSKKQIFIDFEWACKYDGADFFFAKWNFGTADRKNYARFLNDVSRYTKNEQFKQRIARWFEVNEETGLDASKQERSAQGGQSGPKGAEMKRTEEKQECEGNPEIPVSSTELVKQSAVKNAETEQVDKKPEISASSPKQAIETVGEMYVEVPALLEALRSKFEGYASEVESAKKENQRLLEAVRVKELRIAELEADTNRLKTDLESKQKQIEDGQNFIVKLNLDLKEKSMLLEQSQKAVSELDAKLTDLENLYEYAGENKIGELKSELSSRLALEHEKFQEIQSMGMDVDYYESLLIILAKVFKTLKKFGIDC